MSQIATQKVTKGSEFRVINREDVAAWTKKGWAAAPEESVAAPAPRMKTPKTATNAARVPTVTVEKSGDTRIVNLSDAPKWFAKGWKEIVVQPEPAKPPLFKAPPSAVKPVSGSRGAPPIEKPAVE